MFGTHLSQPLPILLNRSQGLPTIHAFDKEQQLVQSFYNAVDTNIRGFILNEFANRWIGVRLDLAAAVSVALEACNSLLPRVHIDHTSTAAFLCHCAVVRHSHWHDQS